MRSSLAAPRQRPIMGFALVRRSASAPPMSDLAPIWLDAPCAALELWRDAGQARWRLNRAARRLGAGCAAVRSRLAGCGRALARRGRGRGRGAARRRRHRPALPRAWPCRRAGCCGCCPAPLPLRRPRPAATTDADKLALMQGFGRIGLCRTRRAHRPAAGGTRTCSAWSAWSRRCSRPASSRRCCACTPTTAKPLLQHHRLALQQAGRYETRYRLLLPDGRQRDVQALAEVRNGPDGQPATLLGVVIDDTESADRVRAQQSISAQLAEALELAKVSVWRIDLRSAAHPLERHRLRLQRPASRAPRAWAWTRCVRWCIPTTCRACCAPPSRRWPARAWSMSRHATCTPTAATAIC